MTPNKTIKEVEEATDIDGILSALARFDPTNDSDDPSVGGVRHIECSRLESIARGEESTPKKVLSDNQIRELEFAKIDAGKYGFRKLEEELKNHESDVIENWMDAKSIASKANKGSVSLNRTLSRPVMGLAGAYIAGNMPWNKEHKDMLARTVALMPYLMGDVLFTPNYARYVKDLYDPNITQTKKEGFARALGSRIIDLYVKFPGNVEAVVAFERFCRRGEEPETYKQLLEGGNAIKEAFGPVENVGYRIFGMVSDFMVLANMVCPYGTKTDNQAAIMSNKRISYDKVRDAQLLTIFSRRVGKNYSAINSSASGPWVEGFAEMCGEDFNKYFLRDRAYQKVKSRDKKSVDRFTF